MNKNLKKEQKLLDARDLTLNVTQEARTWLLAQNEHPEWGARPLRRIIRKWVREPLADYLLKTDAPPGTTLKINAGEGGLIFETNAGAIE